VTPQSADGFMHSTSPTAVQGEIRVFASLSFPLIRDRAALATLPAAASRSANAERWMKQRQRIRTRTLCSQSRQALVAARTPGRPGFSFAAMPPSPMADSRGGAHQCASRLARTSAMRSEGANAGKPLITPSPCKRRGRQATVPRSIFNGARLEQFRRRHKLLPPRRQIHCALPMGRTASRAN